MTLLLCCTAQEEVGGRRVRIGIPGFILPVRELPTHISSCSYILFVKEITALPLCTPYENQLVFMSEIIHLIMYMYGFCHPTITYYHLLYICFSRAIEMSNVVLHSYCCTLSSVDKVIQKPIVLHQILLRNCFAVAALVSE